MKKSKKNKFNYRKYIEILSEKEADKYNIPKRATRHNNERDAWRHTYFNALSTYIFGKKFTKFLGGRFEDIGDLRGQPYEERFMDDHRHC